MWRWGVDEPGELETWCEEGLRLVEERLRMDGGGLLDDCVKDWQWDWRLLRYRF